MQSALQQRPRPPGQSRTRTPNLRSTVRIADQQDADQSPIDESVPTGDLTTEEARTIITQNTCRILGTSVSPASEGSIQPPSDEDTVQPPSTEDTVQPPSDDANC